MDTGQGLYFESNYFRFFRFYFPTFNRDRRKRMAGGKLEHFCVGMRAILGAGVLPIFVLLVDSLVGRGQFINVPQGAGNILPPPPLLPPPSIL
jgi:hypothetical protein